VDVEHRRRVGENLLLLLERLNDMDKPFMVAKAFRALLEGRIDLATFQNLSHAIDFVRMSSIPMLIKIYDVDANPHARLLIGPLEPDPDLQHLAYCGLVSVDWSRLSDLDLGGSSKKLGGYTKNELGKLFFEVAIKQNF
jgi:hypothetical protein